MKKAKFRSLKKGAIASKSKDDKEEIHDEPMYVSDGTTASHETTSSSGLVPLHSISNKKRKGLPGDDDEGTSSKKSKRVKKPLCENASDSSLPSKQLDETRDCESVDLEHKSISRSKMGGKITITCMPVKRVLTIKLEKFRKKGNIWSGDCFPSPDPWLPQEDAVLCALVHEYGSNWSLVSETLYGMAAGGLYRGRYRHPVHCCERFRELILKYVLSAADNPNSEKLGNLGSGKALLRVTEDNVRLLLDVATELPDNEMLLQRHFFHLLSSVWRMSFRLDHHLTNFSVSSSRNGFHTGGRRFTSTVRHIGPNSRTEPFQRMRFNNLSQSRNLVASALCDASNVERNAIVPTMNQREEVSPSVDKLEITLELQRERGDSLIPLPSVINLSISAPCPSPSSSTSAVANELTRTSLTVAENRFRTASRACVEGSLDWVSSTFPIGELKSRTASKSGKHKLSACDSSRASKSKMRKTAAQSSDTHSQVAELVAPPKFSESSYSTMVDLPVYAMPDAFELTPHFEMEEVSLSTESVDLVQHEYDPGFVSGLEDYSSLHEFTDIG